MQIDFKTGTLVSYLKDIRFWIVLFFVVRLYGITNPPLERPVTWRQCDGLMVARNFYEVDNNILYPRVDVAGDKTGIVGSEFPIFNYLIYLVSLIFGFHDWFGRLINLIISSIGVFFYFKLISRGFDERSAFFGSFVMLVSMWFAYSRIVIPDIFGASLCIISLYCALEYFESARTKDFIAFVLLGTLGCLSKISASVLLTALAVPMLSTKILMKRKMILTLGAGFILLTVCMWYFYWVPYLNTTYEFGGHFFMGQPLAEGIQQLIGNWKLTAAKFYDTPLKYSGFAIFLFFLFKTISIKNRIALAIFLFPFVAFLVFVMVSGWGFYVNSYYPIMLVPSMAFVIGIGLSELKNKWAYGLLAIIAIEGISNQVHMFSIRDFMEPYTRLEKILNDSGVKPADLIAINTGGHDPTPMYFAHRKGWGLSNEQLKDMSVLEEIRMKGCQFVLVLHIDSIKPTDLELDRIYQSKNFTIYRL